MLQILFLYIRFNLLYLRLNLDNYNYFELLCDILNDCVSNGSNYLFNSCS